MKKALFLALLPLVVFSLTSAQAQAPDSSPEPLTRPRTVFPLPATPQPSVTVKPTEPVTTLKIGDPASNATSSANETPRLSSTSVRTDQTPIYLLSPATIRSRIGEAERLLRSRPLPTAMTSPSIDLVTLAALDRSTAHIHLITLPKQTFLTKGSEVTVTSSLGTPVNLRVLRANGVNTAVTLDSNGQALLPLVVEFPIEKGGVFRELAYYTSAHPMLLSSDLVQSGKTYVRTMLDLAAKRLSDKGVVIAPQIVNVAERLCVVEHIDHDRFRLENRLALFDEIYSLYALNELDTYRYSVSLAGAGGMVQMIPWAYNLMRQRHAGVGLMPDFVAGMRNHGNAMQAMLLYMQDTWNDLAANEDVKLALDEKIATPTELLAAAYNSNAARLPLYIRRGGSEWRTLIPRETQTYLQIYKTFEALTPLKARPATVSQTQN